MNLAHKYATYRGNSVEKGEKFAKSARIWAGKGIFGDKLKNAESLDKTICRILYR